MSEKKILIACGGSGGHIFPGVALAESLIQLDKNCKIFIVTSDRHIDTQIFKEEKYAYSVLHYNPLPESLNPLKFFKFLLNLIVAISKSLNILRIQKPNCVVGLGGYVSGPIIFAAWLIGKRTIIHEQNILPSLTNRLSAIFANKICVTFDKTKTYFKKRGMVTTGNPVRYDYLKQDYNITKIETKLQKDKFTILVMGGSQGSRCLNFSFKEALSRMGDANRKKMQVLHITGKKDFSLVNEEYEKIPITSEVYAFLDKMGFAYEISDLIISRAGATALSEITAFGKPSILIPHPKRRVHQKENAEFFSNHGASFCIEESNLKADSLKDTILHLMKDPERLNYMALQAKALSKPNAATNLAREVLNLAC